MINKTIITLNKNTNSVFEKPIIDTKAVIAKSKIDATYKKKKRFRYSLFLYRLKVLLFTIAKRTMMMVARKPIIVNDRPAIKVAKSFRSANNPRAKAG